MAENIPIYPQNLSATSPWVGVSSVDILGSEGCFRARECFRIGGKFWGWGIFWG